MSYETQLILLEAAGFVVAGLLSLILIDLVLMLIDSANEQPRCHQTETCPVADCTICGGGK